MIPWYQIMISWYHFENFRLRFWEKACYKADDVKQKIVFEGVLKMKNRKVLILVAVFFSITLVDCSNVGYVKNASSNKSLYQFFKENVPTISWNEKEQKEIKSFSANVKVYTTDSRHSAGQEYSGSYRLMSKEIDGISYSRIDLTDKDGKYFKSMISNDKEMLVYDLKTKTISGRVPVNNDDMFQEAKDFCQMNSFGRLNLDMIRKTAYRLNFDLNEDSDGVLQVSVPSEFFTEPGSTRTLTKLTFDIENETLSEVQTIDINEEGDVITSEYFPVYYEKDGEPVNS